MAVLDMQLGSFRHIKQEKRVPEEIDTQISLILLQMPLRQR